MWTRSAIRLWKIPNHQGFGFYSSPFAAPCTPCARDRCPSAGQSVPSWGESCPGKSVTALPLDSSLPGLGRSGTAPNDFRSTATDVRRPVRTPMDGRCAVPPLGSSSMTPCLPLPGPHLGRGDLPSLAHIGLCPGRGTLRRTRWWSYSAWSVVLPHPDAGRQEPPPVVRWSAPSALIRRRSRRAALLSAGNRRPHSTSPLSAASWNCWTSAVRGPAGCLLNLPRLAVVGPRGGRPRARDEDAAGGERHSTHSCFVSEQLRTKVVGRGYRPPTHAVQRCPPYA